MDTPSPQQSGDDAPFPMHTVTVDGARIAYRRAGSGPALLCVHGYPTSSYLWRRIAPVVGEVATVIAPDLPGFGDSELGASRGTWEEQIEFLERFATALDLGRVDLLVHDWGGLIGLRWACDVPTRLHRLVITDTGFFPDGRWHAFAKTMRTAGDGETLMDVMTYEGFAAGLRLVAPQLPDDALHEYWKGLATQERRAAKLALYRSGDFEKLEPYRGRLGALAPPTLILWGADDRFAPPGGGVRFSREIAGSVLEILPGLGHFLQEDDGALVATKIRDFLRTR
jgi:haloalkane dehalogenase